MAVRGLQTEKFLPLEILNTFCPGGKCKEKTSRGMKVSSIPSFSCVLLFILGPLFPSISVFITWKLKTGFSAIQDLFSIAFLSAHKVWEIRVDIYWRKEEMGVTLLILLFSQRQDVHTNVTGITTVSSWNKCQSFFPWKSSTTSLTELFASPYTTEGGQRSVFIPVRYGDSWEIAWLWLMLPASLGQVSWDGCGVAPDDGEAATVFPTTLEPSAICFPLGTTALLWAVAVINTSTVAVLPPSLPQMLGLVGQVPPHSPGVMELC